VATVEEVDEVLGDLLAKLGPQIKRLLTPEQRRKLPPFVASHLEPRYLASIRSGTMNFAGGSAMPIMGGAIWLPHRVVGP
jgi:hypothetical protein